MNVQLSFGAMAESIGGQLRGQGLCIPDPDERTRLQANADAITRLMLHNLLTDAEGRRARRRLVNHIFDATVPLGVGAESEGEDG